MPFLLSQAEIEPLRAELLEAANREVKRQRQTEAELARLIPDDESGPT